MLFRSKKKSVFSPEYLGGLPEKYGFHPQTFEGGDLEGMKDDLKNVVMSHGFRNEKHRQTALNIINKNDVPWMVWKGMFDFMRAMTHPKERLGSLGMETKQEQDDDITTGWNTPQGGDATQGGPDEEPVEMEPMFGLDFDSDDPAAQAAQQDIRADLKKGRAWVKKKEEN